MTIQVDDELEKYAAKPASDDDELEKYAKKPAPKSGSLDEYLSKPFNPSGSSGSDAPEKPGFFKRLGQSVGAPTSWDELKEAVTPSAVKLLRTPKTPEEVKEYIRNAADVSTMGASPILEGAYNWGKGAVKKIGEGIHEEVEAAKNIRAGQPVIPNIGKAGYGIVHGGVGSIPFIGEPIETAGEDVLNKNYAGAAGGLTGVIGQVAAPELAERGVATAKALPAKTALALRTEEGAVHPAVTKTIGAIGGAGGAALGHYFGAPEVGAIAGYGIGTAAADRLIPNLPHDIPTKTPIGAHLPAAEEFYEGRAEDLSKRGKEQASIDKAAEREQTSQEKTLAKEGKAVPLSQGPYYNQHLETLKAQTEAAKPKIVSPTEGEPRVTGSEGRPATWTNEFVLDQSGKGNRDAISQAVRRGLELPSNARYVMGDPDFPRAVLNPREVTLFSPEGTPIRNKANAQAEAQQGNIPTISRTPRGRIPQIGTGTENISPRISDVEQNVKRETIPPAKVPVAAPLAAKPLAEAPVAATEPTNAAPAATETPAPAREKSETNAIRAELSEYKQKAKKWGDKIASARPTSWKAQRDWMENLEAADKRVSQLQEALDKGTPIKLGPRGATREELTATYRGLGPEDKAAVDELLKEHSILDAMGRERFASEHGLGNSLWKGLPIQEKLAKSVTGKNEFTRSQSEGKIPSIGASPNVTSLRGKLPMISKPTEGAFKVPTTRPLEPQVPPDIEPVLKQSGWEYSGKNSMGQHELREPNSNIKLLLFDRDMNPSFVARKIAEKEKQYGTPKRAPKQKEAGEEEVPF